MLIRSRCDQVLQFLGEYIPSELAGHGHHERFQGQHLIPFRNFRHKCRDGVSIVVKLGKTTIAQATGVSLAAGQQVEVAKLTKAGKSQLRNRDRAAVTVTADIPFGSPATAKGKLS